MNLTYPSPLRYPGGKRKLAQFIKDTIIKNKMTGGTYVEPFAGGASVALFLLYREYVSRVIINDIDRSIYAFWHEVLNNTEQLCDRIIKTEITIDEWERQKAVQEKKATADLLDLAFSTFFLNRTNRSGIISGGVIGGKKQTGDWRMEARFNKPNLIKRIEKVALYGRRIQLHNLDAMDLVASVERELDDRTLIYFDPPYYRQGGRLYVNYFQHEDHERLARFILNISTPWMLTYDYVPQILEMYSKARKRSIILNYSAANKEKGLEMLAFSDGLELPLGNYPSIGIESDTCSKTDTV